MIYNSVSSIGVFCITGEGVIQTNCSLHNKGNGSVHLIHIWLLGTAKIMSKF